MEYALPKLPYAYDALEPFMDRQTLEIHHTKHHRSYVDGLNAALKKLEAARASGDFSAIKALSRELAFHGSGHVLHSLFWESLSPPNESKEPEEGAFFSQIAKDFGSVENFKKHFTEAAIAVEGSGWAVLAWEPLGKKLLILQAEKHQNIAIWGATPLLILDVWEHAYYIKYQNRRAEYANNFWNIANWKEAERKFSAANEA